MPIADLESVSLHYEISGPVAAPAVVLSHSLGSDLHMWDKVVPHLERDLRVLRYDTRGHGGSTARAPWTLEALAEDVLGLLDALSMERVHVCGLSLGGQVALWLGIHAPARVRRLVLANTAARIGSQESWDARIATVESRGMESVAGSAPERWFTPHYIAGHPDEMSQVRAMILRTSQSGYTGCCSVLRAVDLRNELARIQARCLIIAGTHDPGTPPSDGLQLHSGLSKAEYAELNASHLSAWERPTEFAGAVHDFLVEKESGNG